MEIERNKLLIIRPPLIYSWMQKEGYQPGGFLAKAREQGKIYLWGDGKEKREFVDVRDAANITKLLITGKCCGTVLMASGRSYTYRSIAENIKNVTQCQIIEKNRTEKIVNHTYINKRLNQMIGSYEFKKPYIVE